MTMQLGVLLLSSLMLAGGEASEATKFTGSWTVSELIFAGEDLTKDSKLQFRIVFKGDEATIEGSEFIQADYSRLKFKLIASSSPKRMDIVVSQGAQQDVTITAIYAIDGNQLKICTNVFGRDRPTEFASPEGSSAASILLKRLR